jgi:hypothetical protein
VQHFEKVGDAGAVQRVHDDPWRGPKPEWLDGLMTMR